MTKHWRSNSLDGSYTEFLKSAIFYLDGYREGIKIVVRKRFLSH